MAKPKPDKAKGKKRKASRSPSSSPSPEPPEKQPRRANLRWSDDMLMSLISALSEHPKWREKLFSTSASAKSTGTTNEAVEQAIALEIFKDTDNETIRSRLKNDVKGLGVSVHGQLTGIKQRYRAFHAIIGKTGAGLKYEDLWEGSKLKNAVDDFRQKNPWYSYVHEWWRTHPGLNPIAHQNSRSASGEDQANDFQTSRGRRRNQNSTVEVEEQPDDESGGEGGGEVETEGDGAGGDDGERSGPSQRQSGTSAIVVDDSDEDEDEVQDGETSAAPIAPNPIIKIAEKSHSSKVKGTPLVRSASPASAKSTSGTKSTKSTKPSPLSAIDGIKDVLGDVSALTASSAKSRERSKDLEKARQHEREMKALQVKETAYLVKQKETELKQKETELELFRLQLELAKTRGAAPPATPIRSDASQPWMGPQFQSFPSPSPSGSSPAMTQQFFAGAGGSEDPYGPRDPSSSSGSLFGMGHVGDHPF